MGCHTWFYKKTETPTDESIKEYLLEYCAAELKYLDALVNDRESIDPHMLDAYPEWTPEWAKERIIEWSDLQASIQNDSLEKAKLYELYLGWYNDLIAYDEKHGWFEPVDEYHDLFRVGGYPEDHLCSLEETLEYINNPENQCRVYDYTNESLAAFWNKYPDGLIEFG